jgi:hypothetical protein
MKLKTIFLTLTMGALSLFTSDLYAQESSTVSGSTDSAQAMYRNDQAALEKANDEEKMADIKDARRETKAKAKEARRVEREASAAARESKNALRAERRAQKARKQADKQAKKAEKARERADKD